MRSITLAALCASLTLLAACKTGYHRSPRDSNNIEAPECDATPTSPNPSAGSGRILNLLSKLTCEGGNPQGALAGQSVGYGNELITEDHENSYERLVDALHEATQNTPAIVSLDYEYRRVFSDQELLDTNEKLVEHWSGDNNAGFVMVSWSPLNPWRNNFTDFDGNYEDNESAWGSEQDLAHSENVDLNALLPNSGSALYNDVWLPKLQHIATALRDLENEGVTVLFRPLPVMNTNDYWWGVDAIAVDGDKNNAAAYTDLWRELHRYFTNPNGHNLTNLLWVYSPAEGTSLPSGNNATVTGGAPVDWAYPGDDYVDVIAGVDFGGNQLIIDDYETYTEFDKPLGMAGWGPKAPGSAIADEGPPGDFDNRAYLRALQDSYRFMAFWVSGHSYDVDMGEANQRAYRALIDNANTDELLSDSYILTRERVDSKDLKNPD